MCQATFLGTGITAVPPPLLFLSTVNEYVFMVQARGIQIRENVKTIGAQVLEQVVRGAYSINGTGRLHFVPP